MMYKIIEPNGDQWNIYLDFPSIFDTFTCDKGRFIITSEDVDENGNSILYAENCESVDLDLYSPSSDILEY